ncbi:MAG: pyrroline-5-carboxylate reductase [Pseudomonadota bacterium]|nr:pyrroline-5-carboxylate reductase [Pseudomonadota bacterium]
MEQNLLLIGCGKMGNALLKGLLDHGILPKAITIVEPMGIGLVGAGKDVRVFASPNEIEANYIPTIIIFAVKPQVMDEIVPNYKRFVSPNILYLSIAAGKPSTYFERLLGKNKAIIRTMPNTPAAVGCGMTVAFANSNDKKEQKQLAQFLLETIGKVSWLDDEASMDAVTAVSGSGPAYIFLLIECLTKAGKRLGLDSILAEQLARETIIGCGELVKKSEETAENLRKNVTSPGGTTAAALKILTGRNGMETLMIKAIEAATLRSRELSR